jgi:putative ABC transport system permease protein
MWQILRSLFRQRGLSASIVAITALGVGANASLFALAYSVLLRQLPFRASQDVMVVSEAGKSLDTGLVSPTAFLEWRDRKPPFSEMAAFMWWEGSGEDPVLTVSITPNFFDVIGVKPILGRTFTEEENRAGISSATILSYEVWQRRFGGDPTVLGRRIHQGEWNPMIVGVMPPAPINLSIGWGHYWTPIRLRQQYNRAERVPARYLRVIGRLRPGMNREQALAALTAVQHGLQAEQPDIFGGYEVRLTSLRDTLAGEFRPALLILLGSAGCLLLLACASLANMLVARAAEREKEMAVRVALGATRGGLVIRLLASNLILTGMGAIAGFALSRVMTSSIVHFEPRLHTLGSFSGTAGPMVVICAGLAAITAVFVTLPLALSQSQIDVHESLKEGGRGGTASVRKQQIRGLLVSAEVALALTLLVVSGLLARSFVGMMRTDLGFKPENVLLLESDLGASHNNTNTLSYYRPLFQTLSGVSGVAAVGGLRYFPLHARLWSSRIQIQENPLPASEQPIVLTNRVGGNYFEAMGIPLMAGRLPSAREQWEKSDVMLVNAAAARAFFPKGHAVGMHILDDGHPLQVIGVVGDVRQRGMERPPAPEVYTLMGQNESADILTIAIRTRERPGRNTMQSIKNAVQHFNSKQTRPTLIPLETFVGDTITARRMAAQLGLGLALLAVLLAALGIYGLVSYWVTQRTAEFGVRMALGASSGGIFRLVLGHCLRLAGVGTLAGLVTSCFAARLIASFLYGTPVLDGPIFLGAPLLLLAVSVAAALKPAFRATTVNTVDALRSE